MKYTGLAMALCVSLAVATPVKRSAQGPEGYGVEDIIWEVNHKGSDSPISVRGTVQDVVGELSKRDTNAEADIIARGEAKRSLMKETSSFKRDDPIKTTCNGFTTADTAAISDQIRYLEGLDGKPTNGPGPGNCGQVSCSFNAVIWWCNDSSDSKTLNSFSDIANGAHKLQQSCFVSEPGTLGAGVNGQAFYSDDWNVIVQKGSCS